MVSWIEAAWALGSRPSGSLPPAVRFTVSDAGGLASASGPLQCGLTLATGLCLYPRLSFLCWGALVLSALIRLWVSALYSNLGELLDPDSSFLPKQPEPPLGASAEDSGWAAWEGVSPKSPGTLSKLSELPRRGTEEALLTSVFWGWSSRWLTPMTLEEVKPCLESSSVRGLLAPGRLPGREMQSPSPSNSSSLASSE